jgi:hypothetical protein
MTHDKLTALASMAAIVALLSLSAVVNSGSRPLPPRGLPPEDIAVRYPAPVRKSLAVEVLLPLDEPEPEGLPAEPQPLDRQSQKTAIAAPLNLLEVAQCLEAAETASDLQSARSCLEERLAGRLPSSQELAHWICGLREGRHSQAQVMLEVVLTALPGNGVLAYAEEVQSSCLSLQGSDLLARAVMANMDTKAAWAAAVSERLDSAQLFDPLASTLALDVAYRIALTGNGLARDLIEVGAAGFHGGTDEQILHSAQFALELQKDGGERIGFLTGLVESQFTPGESGMGSFFADTLLQPGNWDGEDPSTAVALLNRIISDERFRLNAGRALVGNLGKAPLGANENAWARLIDSESFKRLQAQVLMIAPD